MTAKADLMHQVRLLSSGTIATFIGDDRYKAIGLASCLALQLISSMTGEECSRVQTLEDIRNLFIIALKIDRCPTYAAALKIYEQQKP